MLLIPDQIDWGVNTSGVVAMDYGTPRHCHLPSRS